MSSQKPFPSADTLRDLALLRASNVSVHLANLVPDPHTHAYDHDHDHAHVYADVHPHVHADVHPHVYANADDSNSLDESILLSREFIAETRAALKAYNSGELQRKNRQLQEVEKELKEIMSGLSS